MLFVIKKSVLGLALAAALTLTGCASGGAAESSGVPSTQALACSKCKVTYVNVPTKLGKNIVGYHDQAVMECPDCKDAAENFFTTGKFEHSCKTCGNTMSACAMHAS